jgi:hypothetical protein
MAGKSGEPTRQMNLEAVGEKCPADPIHLVGFKGRGGDDGPCAVGRVFLAVGRVEAIDPEISKPVHDGLGSAPEDAHGRETQFWMLLQVAGVFRSEWCSR